MVSKILKYDYFRSYFIYFILSKKHFKSYHKTNIYVIIPISFTNVFIIIIPFFNYIYPNNLKSLETYLFTGGFYMTEYSKELNKLLQNQRENNSSHLDMNQEYSFYRKVQNGEYDSLDQLPNFSINEGMGKLSQDPFRNEVYHAIILITMLTRFCVEGGMDLEYAYLSSDFFIQKIDLANKIEDIIDIKKNASLHYSTSMKKLRTSSTLSPHIIKAKDYIENNITLPLTNIEIANHIGLHQYYLSKLFKAETGLTLSDYICQRKCEVAKYMLSQDNSSCTDVATFLGYSSTSHFISRFKSVVGITPNQYKKMIYRKGLM